MMRTRALWNLAGVRAPLRALVVWAVLAQPAALAQPDLAPLFAPQAGTPKGATVDAADESTVRTNRRMVRANRDVLRAVREQVSSVGAGKLRLNLLDDVELEATLERSTPTASGYTLSGPLDGVPFGRVVLVVNDGVTMGRVYTPEGNYSIRGTSSLQTVERMPASPWRCATAHPEGDELARGDLEPRGSHADAKGAHRRYGTGSGVGARAIAAPVLGAPSVTVPTRGFNHAARMAGSRDGSVPRTKASPAAAESDADDGDVVDVLVVYPSFVPEIESGYADMLALIDLDIATANEAYAASGVKLRVELAAAVEVEYDWFLERVIVDNEGFGAWFSALDHLSNPQDGHLDEVHALRDRHAADLVLMHLGGEVHQLMGRYQLAGVARAISDVSAESVERLGFAVARSGDGTAVAHELGHSMGLGHDRFEGSNNKPFPYSHGFRYWHPGTRERGVVAAYGTIMSQSSGVGAEEFVLAFSNPDLIHPHYDIPLGVPGDQPSSEEDGPADATRHLNELRGVLANVRSRADAESCRYEVIGDDGKLPAAGGAYRLRVETESGCTWTAKGGDWVSSVSAAGGTGSGDIEYTVGANDGFQRPVELLVAGQSHLRRQTGSRPITPVCERSGHMAEHLMQSHPDFREDATSNGNVVIVTYRTPCHELNFDADYLASIRSLDFDGTWGTIGASHFRPGDFDGMSGLAELQLHAVGDLPAGFFDGLVGLRFLSLRADGWYEEGAETLRSITPGAFRGLPGLKRLAILHPQLRRIETGSFEGLSGLLVLQLWHSVAELTLEPGAFTGLSSLWTLRLYDNELVRLDSGVFDGLPRLRYLFLTKNSLREVDADVFRGLPRLKNLVISNNPLAALPAGLFDGLGNLVNLYVEASPVKRLPGAIFEDLRSLEVLVLRGNELTRIEPDTFTGLSSVWNLNLQYNQLRSIAPRVFSGLESLYWLRLRGNFLGILPAGAFHGLRRLGILDLSDAGVTRVEPGALQALVEIDQLYLQKNRLQELESGAFRGLAVSTMHLQDNPGSPFQFLPTPAVHASERVVGEPVEVVAVVDPEAPFWMDLELSAAGGSWTGRRDVEVRPGESRVFPRGVVPDGNGPVTVSVDRIEWPGLADSTFNSLYGPRYSGFRVAPGPPLLLYGISDVELTRGRDARRVDMASVFSYFLGTGIDYTVSSSDPAMAEVRIEDGTLVLKPDRPGATEVTVTAAGMDGETMTRTFAVTVQVPSAPLVLSGSHFGKEGFVRLINRQGHAGSVQMTAVDDAGTRRDPVVLKLAAHGVAHFNSDDLEDGNVGKGLPAGVGFGDGDWRLEFDSALDIEALAYVRTEDGFLATMHDVAAADGNVHRIAVFNPAGNTQQVSRLRVVNPGREAARVTVRGVDDSGASPGSPVRFTVPGDAAREFDAVQLESGDPDLDGALGDGEGKWRLTVESASPVVAMSLLENTSTGHLTNLSSGTALRDDDGVHHVPLLPASGPVGREGFVRVVNRSDSAGSVNIAAFDDAGTEFGPLELAVDAGAAAHFNSDDLELGASGKGLSGSTGTGEGDWRLELTSDLDVEVFAYVRTDDGFLTVMHDVAPLRDGRHEVVTFNPGSNADQVSSLRLVNPSSVDVLATIVGTDDTGRAPLRKGAARVTVPGRGALTLTAQDLEVGVQSGLPAWEDDWSHNALGDGKGKWRLAVTADAGLLVMSLLESPTGHLTNLSSVPH